MVQVDWRKTGNCQPYAAKEKKNDITETVLSYLSWGGMLLYEA